jgi:hypothetical protein
MWLGMLLGWISTALADQPWRTNFDLTQTSMTQAGWQEQKIWGSLILDEGEPGEPTVLLLEGGVRRKLWTTESQEGRPERTREPLICFWQGGLDAMTVAPEMPLLCEGTFEMACREEAEDELLCKFIGAVPPLMMTLQEEDGMLFARGHNVRISIRSDERSSADRVLTQE